MRQIKFYDKPSGSSPVVEFLDSLPGKQAQKLIWVLRLIEEMELVPKKYFKKLVSTDDIWEVISKVGSNRLLGFYQSNLVMLTNGFVKKTQKTPPTEIDIAEQRKREYLSRSKK